MYIKKKLERLYIRNKVNTIAVRKNGGSRNKITKESNEGKTKRFFLKTKLCWKSLCPYIILPNKNQKSHTHTHAHTEEMKTNETSGSRKQCVYINSIVSYL